MIKSSLKFSYNGYSSDQMGLLNVSTDSGLFNETFVAGKRINEDQIEGRDKRYLKNVEYEPLEIPVTFYFQDKWDEYHLRQVAQWLSQDAYKELIFSESPEKIYYAMPVEPIQVIHNGLKQGYLTLTFRCDSHHAYSKYINSPKYDFSSNTASGTNIVLDNKGDLSLFPTVYIQKIGAGDVTIQNNSNGGQQFTFTGLNDTENLTVSNEYHEITTDQVNIYRYKDFNMNWLEIVAGKNNLTVFGNCKIMFEYQYKYL